MKEIEPEPIQDNVWHRSPGIVQRFVESQPRYRDLSLEVESLLEKLISHAGIQISTVSSRTKTLSSFVEKIERKGYADPFIENTDFAGARVVCLFPADVVKIGDIVKKNFVVKEIIDKRSIAR